MALGLTGMAFFAYRRPFVPLTRVQRAGLIALRAMALVAVFLFACRPVLLSPPANAGDVVVPVLVDSSRSMRIADANGSTRIAQVQQLLTSEVLPALNRVAKVEIFRVGEGVQEAPQDGLAADARRSELAAAVASVRERVRGRRVAGVLLFSDGADTSTAGARTSLAAAGAPVFAIGVGSAEGVPDREVVGITASDPRLDQALVDLHVTSVTHGLGRDAYNVRLLSNGQLSDTRRVVPAADGSPSDEVFSVAPDPLNATVFTAEIVPDARETITENNTRSVLLSPAARKRRLLMLAGSPGYEHSFLIRALSQDPSVEIDSIVRKGKDDSGRDTFLIQAGGGRGAGLVTGFPTTRESLFAYDAVVINNLEGEFFGRAQMDLLADFVSVRGGGILLLGSRTFLQRGIAGSPLEEALPVELNDRRGGAPTRTDGEGGTAPNAVTLTEEGAQHPIMRIAATPEATRKQWATLPPLASSSPVGGPRPGATVLAVTQAGNGAAVPLVAVQRYGRGRSMIFSGEASWRWKMLRPAEDRSYDVFWRQAARWLASDAPDPVTVAAPDNPVPGDSITVDLEARDAGFQLVADAAVEATLTAPGREPSPLALRPAGTGHHAATVAIDAPGLYRLRAEARRGPTLLGVADRWFYAGGADPEYADPRLNEAFLRRLARQTGGQYAPADELGRVLSALSFNAPQSLEPERRDLWHEPWAFALVLLVLSAEWVMRRTVGMR